MIIGRKGIELVAAKEWKVNGMRRAIGRMRNGMAGGFHGQQRRLFARRMMESVKIHPHCQRNIMINQQQQRKYGKMMAWTKSHYEQHKKLYHILFMLWCGGWLSFWLVMYVLRQFYLKWKEERRQSMMEEEQKVEFETILADMVQEEGNGEDSNGGGMLGKLLEFLRLSLRFMYLSMMFGPTLACYPLFWLLGKEQAWYAMLVATFRRCGPCFVKLGQWMGTKMEWFPPEFCHEMAKLHSDGNRHSVAETRRVIEEALGRPVEEIFSEFGPDPIASGAIAQVYKATLRETGETVAVKVRHPGVRDSMIMDLLILQRLTGLAGSIPSLQWLNLEENVIVFSRDMKAQLNLMTEAKNLDKFNHNFHDIPNIDFPQPFVDYCSPTVLVESFEEGIPISEFTKMLSSKEMIATSSFKKQLASLGIVLYLKMLVCDNFLHSDLHPGNIFVRINDHGEESTPSLVVLDAGLVCKLSSRDKQNFLDLFLAITQREGRKVAEMMITRSRKYRDIDSLEELEGEEREHCFLFVQEMNELIEEVIDQDLGEMQVARVMGRVLDIGRKYTVEIEPNFTSLIIASMTMEGLAKQLDPLFNFVNEATPVLEEVGTELRNEFLKNRFMAVFDAKVKNHSGIWYLDGKDNKDDLV